MTTIDLLIPPPDDGYAPVARDHARPYVDAFARIGIDARPVDWTGPDIGKVPALALLAWGYHLRLDLWDALIAGWPAEKPLLNPPALLRWNTRKTYLRDLDAAGVPTVPTWFGDADAGTVAAAFEAFGADEVVVKPQVSAGSHDTYRLTRGDAAPHVRAAMIQPFLPAIRDEGEYSLFRIGGAFSHEIRKRPTGGDFRIQPQFGGTNERWQPDTEAIVVAEAALRAVPSEPLYARIDLLRRLDGRLALIEFEAIEPDLYLDHGNGVAERLAQAVAAALAHPPAQS